MIKANDATALSSRNYKKRKEKQEKLKAQYVEKLDKWFIARGEKYLTKKIEKECFKGKNSCEFFLSSNPLDCSVVGVWYALTHPNWVPFDTILTYICKKLEQQGYAVSFKNRYTSYNFFLGAILTVNWDSSKSNNKNDSENFLFCRSEEKC